MQNIIDDIMKIIDEYSRIIANPPGNVLKTAALLADITLQKLFAFGDAADGLGRIINAMTSTSGMYAEDLLTNGNILADLLALADEIRQRIQNLLF